VESGTIPEKAVAGAAEDSKGNSSRPWYTLPCSPLSLTTEPIVLIRWLCRWQMCTMRALGWGENPQKDEKRKKDTQDQERLRYRKVKEKVEPQRLKEDFQKRKKSDWGYNPVVEHLPSMCEALGSSTVHVRTHAHTQRRAWPTVSKKTMKSNNAWVLHTRIVTMSLVSLGSGLLKAYSSSYTLSRAALLSMWYVRKVMRQYNYKEKLEHFQQHCFGPYVKYTSVFLPFFLRRSHYVAPGWPCILDPPTLTS
jgi:hypothetical protein